MAYELVSILNSLELEDFIQTQGDVTQSVLKSLRSDDNQLRVLGENWPAIFKNYWLMRSG